MLKFFKKVLFFGIFLFILLLIIIISSITKVNYDFNNYRFPIDTQNIIIGDSHAQLTLIDSLLTKTKNLGQTGEPMMMSYYKLVNFISVNPRIKRVFLSVGYNNLSSSSDRDLFGGNGFEIPARYFPMLPTEEKLKLLKGNGKDLPQFLAKIVSVNTKAILLNRMPILGKFNNNFKNTTVNILSVRKRINNHFYDENRTVDGYSALSFNYIEKISQLCNRSNIELVIIKTPLHDSYYKAIPLKFKLKYDSIVNSDNYKFIDLNNVNLKDSDFIPDGDHVSASGALKATIKFKELIK